MTQYLPPNLLALFAPRDPVPYLPPLDKLPHEKKNTGYTPIGFYVTFFEDPKDTPPPTRVETREERLERKRREKQEQAAYKLEQDIALWDPITNPNCTTDPYKTLFVARINYDTSESKLRREFEVYGSIKKIHLVHDVKTGKPRGYAFIEYEHERDMHSAYKHADGKKIDGRRVLVDVERARTVKGWLPRRLGGGLGGTRRGGPDVNIKHSGREEIRGDERERVDRPERGGGGGVAAAGGGGTAAAAGSGGERERERGERRRSDSRNRERAGRRNRSRSRSRERDAPRTRRERRNKRSRDRSRDKESRSAKVDRDEEKIDPDLEIEEAPKRKRSRSRDRDRKRRRSRSRSHDRERKKRDRSRRDRDRDHEERPGKAVSVSEIKDEREYSNGPTSKDESNEDYNNSEDYSRYNESQYGEEYEAELDDYNGYQIKQED